MIVEVNKIFQFRLPQLQPPPNQFSGQSFYFGAPSTLLFPEKSKTARNTSNKNALIAKKKSKPRQVALSQVMTETLDELRIVREEMEALRRELRALKKRMSGDSMDEEDEVGREERQKILLARRKQRQREFDRLAREIERWAEQALFHEDGEQDGWKEVQCNKLIQHAFNRKGNIRAYVKVR